MREIGEVPAIEQSRLRDIGDRACSLSMSIHPTIIRQTLATAYLEHGSINFATILGMNDKAFRDKIEEYFQNG